MSGLWPAFAVLSVTVLLGGWLLMRRRGWVGVAHAASGAIGLAAGVWAWRRGALGGVFAADAIWLLAAGLAAGIVLGIAALRRRRPADAVLVLHIALAGIGYLLLAGFAIG